jgi:vacuolar protein sorting-associated protein 54
MIMTNVSAAGHFQSLATNAVTKVAELLRLFNTRTTNLVLGAGAIHSAARLKSINAKHLSMVTQCLGMVTALLPHIRASLMAQLPPKQHTLLNEIDKIKKDYTEHSEKVLNKFVTIIGGIVEHGLAPHIAGTDFDARAADPSLVASTDEILCCVFLEGVATNTRKMHQVLDLMLPPEHLQDVFSRIFAYLDNKVPTLLVSAATNPSSANGAPTFCFPSSDDGKHRLLLEVESMTLSLNGLAGVLAWDFTCTNVLERKMDYNFRRLPSQDEEAQESKSETPDELVAQTTPSTPNLSDVEVAQEALVPVDVANGDP